MQGLAPVARDSFLMTFADPRRCLSCLSSIDEGVAVCPHCGMNLGSTEIQQAWRALVVADQWVARARDVRAGTPRVESAASATQPPVASGSMIAAPAPGRRL